MMPPSGEVGGASGLAGAGLVWVVHAPRPAVAGHGGLGVEDLPHVAVTGELGGEASLEGAWETALLRVGVHLLEDLADGLHHGLPLHADPALRELDLVPASTSPSCLLPGGVAWVPPLPMLLGAGGGGGGGGAGGGGTGLRVSLH